MVAAAVRGCPPLMNSGTRNKGISITLAVLMMLLPSGMGRTEVCVMSMFMIVSSLGQNHACMSAKSFGVSFRIGGRLVLGSTSFTKAKVCPLLGCWKPNVTPRCLMPWRMMTLFLGFMTASRGNRAGCSPKIRSHMSGVQLASGVNMPSKTCWESQAPSIGLPFSLSMWHAFVRGPSVVEFGKLKL